MSYMQPSKAVPGNSRDLLPRLSELTNSINGQSSDIVTAIEAVNRVAAKFAQNSAQFAEALDTIPGALRVLNANGSRIVETFAALRRFAEIAGSHSGPDQDRLRRRPQTRLCRGQATQ